MKPLILTLGALLALAGCGVDGPPLRPVAASSPTPGISVSGDARIGIRSDDL